MTRDNPNPAGAAWSDVASLKDVQDILRINLIWRDSRKRQCVASFQPRFAGGARARLRCVGSVQRTWWSVFRANARPMRFVEAEKPGFFKRLFGGGKACVLLLVFVGRNKTAPVARERLQIILAHERSGRNAATRIVDRSATDRGHQQVRYILP